MKKILLCCVMVITGILPISSPSKAQLLSINQDVVYETVGDQYWFQDLSYFVNMNYDQQIEAVEALDGTWRMANDGDIYNLWAYSSIEIGQTFTPSYSVINQYTSTVSTGWRGRADYIFSDGDSGITHATPNIWKEGDTWYDKIIFGSFPDTVSEFLGAWVVTDSCPLTSLELADALYTKINEAEISDSIKSSYLIISRQIIDFINKGKTNNALTKIDTLANDIQVNIDNYEIDPEIGGTFITIIDILRYNL